MTQRIGWNFNNSYESLPDKFYSIINPNPVEAPKLVVLNESLAKELGLNPDLLKEKEAVNVFAGNKVPEGGASLAQAYAGHQFGNFTMLGDGRALLVGEQITPGGERFDIQLKGSGRTPYSRGGDGRAALGPMLREYIISEAMHGLGIPTTRSLAVVTTGEPVIREEDLPGAIMTRVASSHLRVGTFEFASQWGSIEELQALADYAIERHYPKIKDDEFKYLTFYKEVIKRQASLIAKWQLNGFIHGVMNTDNMTISGETIDYGPCAFMDTYDPETVFSSIDVQGRYAYGNQPGIGAWNLARFAETLIQLFYDKDKDKAVAMAQEALSGYGEQFNSNWMAGMRAKLGLFNEEKEDETLIKELLNLMHEHSADYTNTFRLLTIGKKENTALFSAPEFEKWYKKWQERLERQEESKESSEELMRKSNPAIIPRNHRVEEAIEAAVEDGDFSVMEDLVKVLSNPFAYSPEQKEYCQLPPKTGEPYRTYCGT
ncbi:protein adenylyltransferase SelO [Fictibacillus phosphorivorans]|uniref:protein adenylyltransferase SelO n=1 Tax=Fictibacillus phosphorivorans TaxID=1221500 RepID=UPI00203C1478|nr:YdiU family protein [Fictibacillus phosphorivorans]MCM3718151.1 YdiU family protein [Fictibacillus phosphorivorans]MCM3775778.1 YdiU family protein [Fictibacillus phosphorivorans]